MKKSPVLSREGTLDWQSKDLVAFACDYILSGLFDLRGFKRIRIVVRATPSAHSITVRSCHGEEFAYSTFPNALLDQGATYLPLWLQRLIASVSGNRDTVHVEIEEA
jgi:hypothetical protein